MSLHYRLNVEDNWPLLLLLLIAALTLPQSTLLPEFMAYAVVLIFYLVLFAKAIATGETILTSPRWIISLLSVLAGLFLLQLALSPSLAEMLRVPVFLTLAFLNILYLPHVLSLRYTYGILSRIAAVTVLIGLIPLLGGPSRIGFLDLSPWHAAIDIGILSFHPPTSTFINPNAFGFLAMVGVLASAAEYNQYKHPLSNGLLAVNTMGLFLSYYRTGIIAVMAAGILYVSWKIWGYRALILTIVAGSISAIVGIGMVVGLFPAPAKIASLTFNGREFLWEAAISAFVDQPLLGYGFGQGRAAIQPYITNPQQVGRGFHNSYLRLFIVAGIFGGVAYLLITFLTVMCLVRQLDSDTGFFLLCFVVVAIIVQMFSGLTLFGASMHSSLLSLMVGFAIKHITGSARAAPAMVNS